MRQVTVCEALMNYPEISDVAKSIGVADKTIKSHITSVMRALGMPKSGRRHYILLFLFPLMVIAPVEGELPGGKSN